MQRAVFSLTGSGCFLRSYRIIALWPGADEFWLKGGTFLFSRPDPNETAIDQGPLPDDALIGVHCSTLFPNRFTGVIFADLKRKGSDETGKQSVI